MIFALFNIFVPLCSIFYMLSEAVLRVDRFRKRMPITLVIIMLVFVKTLLFNIFVSPFSLMFIDFYFYLSSKSTFRLIYICFRSMFRSILYILSNSFLISFLRYRRAERLPLVLKNRLDFVCASSG